VPHQQEFVSIWDCLRAMLAKHFVYAIANCKDIVYFESIVFYCLCFNYRWLQQDWFSAVIREVALNVRR